MTHYVMDYKKRVCNVYDVLHSCILTLYDQYAMCWNTRNKSGWLVGKSAGLVIERLQVQIPARAAGEFLLQS